jgi:hypothetical protein
MRAIDDEKNVLTEIAKHIHVARATVVVPWPAAPLALPARRALLLSALKLIDLFLANAEARADLARRPQLTLLGEDMFRVLGETGGAMARGRSNRRLRDAVCTRAQALADVLGGHVELMFADLGVVMPYAASGRLRAVAITGAKRSPQKRPRWPHSWPAALANPRKNPHAVALGRRGGKKTSPAKKIAARLNGLKGGKHKTRNNLVASRGTNGSIKT